MAKYNGIEDVAEVLDDIATTLDEVKDNCDRVDSETYEQMKRACGFRKFWPLDSGNSGASPRDAGRLS